MKFANREPTSWKELQDLVAKYLFVAGYKTITPYVIDTVRGKVEVDVFIQSPNELIKYIICECKYWDTPVTKEKIHAFRTVVNDSGAELGIIIAKTGYQKGAIAAAKFSNVRLETWSSFLKIIENRWIENKLWTIKTMAARVMSFADIYEYESEKLTKEEYLRYKTTCQNMSEITNQCLMVCKSDLINNSQMLERFCITQKYDSIEQYLDYLFEKLSMALDTLEQLTVKPNKPERYIATMKSMMEASDI